MKVNEVLRKGEVALRVLATKDDYCFCINCNTDFMPAWMPLSTLDEYAPDTAPMIDMNMTAKQKQVAHDRYTMIACFPDIRSDMLFHDLFKVMKFTAQQSGAD